MSKYLTYRNLYHQIQTKHLVNMKLFKHCYHYFSSPVWPISNRPYLYVNNNFRNKRYHSSQAQSHDVTVKQNILNHFCTRDQHLTLIDMTYGDGHYTKLLLENLSNVKIICLDRDRVSYENAKTLSEIDNRVVALHGKFSDLPQLLRSLDYSFNRIDGMLIDVGVSDTQAKSMRGFSTACNSVLDMRMDETGITAYEMLSAIEEHELAKVLKTYGEEKHSKKIARAIVETRYLFKRIRTTEDLSELVSAVIGTDTRVDVYRNRSEHVAQKVFNGVRRFVNNELNELNYAMLVAEKYLKPDGAGTLLTKCNSIVEDKIVKRHLTGNVLEHSANEMALKYVNCNLSLDPESMQELTYSPWTMLTKVISVDSELKLRVASKK